MTRRISRFVMSVALWAAFVGAAWGATETVNGITCEYSIYNGEARLGIGWRAVPTTTSGGLVIPSKLGGCPVTSIGDWAFRDCSWLTSVTIPSSVTSIGDGAFEGCSGLTSVTIPEGVTSIGNYAFSGCSGLTSVTIPEGVTSIGESAFYCCSGLTSVTIPEGVTSIGSEAFRGCSGLKSVTIPEGVTSIGYRAFSDCSGLTSVTIPEGVTSIGNYAFSGCSGLKAVTIPEGVTSIGKDAFSGCSGLTKVTIPSCVKRLSSTFPSAYKTIKEMTLQEGVTNIESSAFSGCSGLTTVTIPEGVTSIGYGAFYGCSGLESVTIPSSVTSIGSSAFLECDGLTTVSIPSCVKRLSSTFPSAYKTIKEVTLQEGVTNIESSAFFGCSGLTTLTIPSSMTSIGTSAFRGCSGLESVTIPSSVTSIGSSAFLECDGLTKVTIPSCVTSLSSTFPSAYKTIKEVTLQEGVTSIGICAFNGCSGLTSVTIPEGVTSIGECAFSGCSGLTSVTIPEGVTSIGWCAFSGCNGLTSVTIPSSVTSIESSAFNGCSGLTSVTIPEGVTSIGSEAFRGCSGLTSVTIPSSVTSIGSEAFRGCSGLKSVTIPSTVTSIGRDAFEGCRGLVDESGFVIGNGMLLMYYGDDSSVTIPESVTSIGSSAFLGCDGLTTVTIPEGVTSIGSSAFLGCDGLTTVTIPEGVTSIGNYAFSGCNGLTSVTIPSSVRSIGDSAFEGCSGLTSVTIPEGVTSIGSEAFRGCSGLTSVTIPSSVTSIGFGAFYYCSGLTHVNIADLAKWCGICFYQFANPLEYAHSLYLKGDEVKDLTIPEGVTSIGGYAFSGCSGLTSVTIPEGVTSIGDCAFDGCSGLTSVTIPEGVTSIGSATFFGCYGLTSVTIPEGVTSIGYRAFYRCSGLTSVTIPSSVRSIGDSAFDYCSGLTHVDIADLAKWCGIYFGDLWANPLKYAHSLYLKGDEVKDLTIPEGVTSIGDYAFSCCNGLTSVSIPESVTNIGDSAFYECGGLKSLTIPSRVTSIGESAFNGCGLTSVTIPSSVTSIGDWAFGGGESLTTVTISKGVTMSEIVTSAGSFVFSGRSGLTTVTISDGVTCIWDGAFYGCDGLTSVTIPSSVRSIGDYAFEGCSGLTSVTMAEGVTNIGNYAFSGCSELTSVAIPSSMRSIGDYAFSGCSELTTMMMPEGVTSIGSCAFEDCSGLKSVSIPSSVSSIGGETFAGCSGLTNMVLPFVGAQRGNSGTIGSLLGYIFDPNRSGASYSGMLKVNQCYNRSLSTSYWRESLIPSSLRGVEITDETVIGFGAFYGCYMLRSVTIPEGVASIGTSAFYGCSGLESVTIPSSVTSIASSAFCGCRGLTSVTIPSSVTSIEDCAFKGCCLETVYVDTGKSEDVWRMLENSNSELNFEDISFVEVDGKEIVGGHNVVVTFKSYDGSVETQVRDRNEPLGTLPSPQLLTGCSFDGWFTAEVGGLRISEKTIADGNVRFYAHWSMTDCGTISSEGVQLWKDGPYWAEQNLGASRPEEYGYYFKWADAVGYSYEGGKIEVGGADYSVGNSLSGYWVSSEGVRMSSSPFTKSNSLNSKSITQLKSGGYVSVGDEKITAAHDAVRVNWGGPWRMPTKDENEELADKCTFATVTRNGVLGRLVVGKGDYAGKSIFIPFAGYIDGSSAFAVGALSVRWSSTFTVDGNTWYSWNYWHNTDDYERWWRKHGEVAGKVWQGSSIRAVRDADSGSSATVRFTVSFSANGGEMIPQTREVTMGQPLGGLPTPTRTDWVFVGWFTEPDAGREVTAQTVVPGNVTYYAHWKRESDPGQETGAGLSFTTGGSAPWFVVKTSHDENGAAQSGAIRNAQSSWLQTTVAGPGRLSFWWKVSSASDYDKLYWYLDGVEQGAISGERDWARVTAALSAGSHVVKWTYKKDESDSSGQDCAWVDQVEVGALSVVATFDANGETSSSSRTVNAGNPLGTLPTVTRTGYQFLGWFTAATGGTQVTAATVVTTDVTYYAHWAAHAYTISFEANGGSGTMADQVFAYDVAQNLRANAFVRSGYYFGGWSLAKDGKVNYGDSASVSKLTAEAAGRVVLYAYWVEKSTPPPPINPPVEPSAGEVLWPEDDVFSAVAANVYDGILWDGKGVVGSVQVKTAKQSVKKTTDKVTKAVTMTTNITVTATVTDANGKKWSYSKGVVTVDGIVTGLKCTTKGCPVAEFGVALGQNGLEGAWDAYEIHGARNGMGVKGDEMMSALEAYTGKWSVTIGTLRLQLNVGAKGVVKIAGNWESGAKVSASAQLAMGDGFVYVPVAVKATKTSPALNALIRIAADGEVALVGEGELVAGGLTVEALGTPTYEPSAVSKGGAAFRARVAVDELAYPAKFAAKGLPSGLKIDAATGVISGTPTKPGHYVVTVTVTSGLNSKIAKTLTVGLDIANYTDAKIPIADAYGPYYVGVAVNERLAAAADCTVSGLPGGLKWTAKDVVDSKTKTVTSAENSVYGVPTKAGESTVYFKKTVKENGKGVTHQASATFRVEGMKSWAVGTFDGGSESGVVQLTVGATGKISGKWMCDGLTWTLSAASFDAYDAERETYHATLSAKSGSELLAVEIELSEEGIAGELFGAWRNDWKIEPWKTLATKLKGKTLTVGDVTLTVGASGAVSAKGTFGGLDGKPYSATCATVLIPDDGSTSRFSCYLYFPPKAGKFEGYAEVIALRWNGTIISLDSVGEKK